MKFKISEIIGIILFLSATVLFLSLFSYLNDIIWLDEYFTLYSIVMLPFNQMVGNIIIDVHPPFYYLVLYSIFQVLTLLKISFNEIFVGKLFSLISAGFLLMFNLFIIKKEFGWLFTGIYSICIVALPNFMFHGTEVRMYSLLLLVIILTFFYSYKVTKKSNLKNWILLTLLPILAIYTQYFSVFIVVSIYLALFFWFIVHNKKNEIRKWFLSSVVGLLLCLPLISLIDYQIGYGKASWIPLPTLNSLVDIFKFVFVPNNEILTVTKISELSILLFIFFIVLIVYYYLFYLKKLLSYDFRSQKFLQIKEIIKKQEFLVLGIGVFILSIVLSFISSYVFIPNFQARYLFPCLGILYLSFTFLLTKTYSKKIIFIPIMIVLLLSCSISTWCFVSNQQDSIITNGEYEDFMHSIDKNNTIIITTNYFRWSIIHFYGGSEFRPKTYLYKPKDVYTTDNQTLIEKIDENLKQSKNIYFFSYENFHDLKKLLYENELKLVEVKKLHETMDNCIYYPNIIYKVVKT